MNRIVIFAVAVALSSCKHDKAATSAVVSSGSSNAPGAAAASAGTVVDGVRTIAIQANADGYTPGKISGKPNEKLMLVFTRTVDSTCLQQLKTPSGEMVDLPLNQPVKVAVTVPASGELGFACGMDMYRGVIVAQ